MNISNLEQLLVSHNPHWRSPIFTSTGYRRDAFTPFAAQLLQPKLILSLSGPRRSGKTFLLKQAMAHLVSQHPIPPHNIFYFQFSGALNERNLVTTALDLFLTKYAQPGPKYIFLDEIQSIDYWQDQVKAFYDQASDLKFIVSGSTSLFYRQKSRESLAGRLYKFNLGALNFAEYCRFKNLPEPSHDRATFVTNLGIYQTEFPQFLALGQYPEIVANKDIDPQKYILDLADQIINFDIPYFASNVDRSLFLNLVKTLSFDLAQEYSASNLAQTLGCDRRVITDYIKILEELSLFKTCYNSAYQSLRKRLSSSKKIYSLNLNLSLHINGFDASYLGDTRVYGHYFENYIFQRLSELSPSPVEYYRQKGHELDFVVGSRAFEIKSSQIKDINQYQILATRLKKDFTLVSDDSIYLL